MRPCTAGGLRRCLLEPGQPEDLPVHGWELQQMRAADAASTTPPIDRIQLSFALGKALEDRGCWAESFQFYEQGNLLRKSEVALPPGNRRAQHPVANRDSAAARFSSAPPCGFGLHGRGAHLHRRSATVRLDSDRADTGRAPAGRRHYGAGRHSADGAWNSRAASRGRATLSGVLAELDRRRAVASGRALHR